jgi:5'-nucleotidase
VSTTPVFLVDMDGPLADFDRLFFDRCAENGWRLDCTLEEQRHRHATDHLPDRRERRLARQMVHTTRWFLDLPVTPGAQEGLEALAAAGQVWIVTKPLEANPWCRDDKAAWLERSFGEQWVQRLIVAPDKSMIRGDVLLDDAPREDWFAAASWRPVIFSRPWNGAGSRWADLPHWSWGDRVDVLTSGIAPPPLAARPSLVPTAWPADPLERFEAQMMISDADAMSVEDEHG